ncbi:MgtC/SapB family protein [Thermogemmatispora aurantia]|uniref:MgtC/SapB family protein n=1 Tax=Thermogemmatispora aurantia TaxID=2045279 RepID=UPI00124DA9C9
MGLFLVRLSSALACGLAIGLERQYRQRAAGLRTSALVQARGQESARDNHSRAGGAAPRTGEESGQEHRGTMREPGGKLSVLPLETGGCQLRQTGGPSRQRKGTLVSATAERGRWSLQGKKAVPRPPSRQPGFPVWRREA